MCYKTGQFYLLLTEKEKDAPHILPLYLDKKMNGISLYLDAASQLEALREGW